MKRSRGRADLRGRGNNIPHLEAHVAALEAAYEDWVITHGEPPPWDDLNFRGGHTTTEVIIEFWEDGT